MRRYGFMLPVLCLCSAINIMAQEWSAQDSTWLRRILSGEEELRLNDAARKAIREGTLISTDPAHGKQPILSVPPELPVTKAFEKTEMPEKKKKKHDRTAAVHLHPGRAGRRRHVAGRFDENITSCNCHHKLRRHTETVGCPHAP